MNIGVDSQIATEKTTEKTPQNHAETSRENTVTVEKTTEKIIRYLRATPTISNKELANLCGITEDGIFWNMKQLKKNGLIRRVGPDKGGHWEVIGQNEK